MCIGLCSNLWTRHLRYLGPPRAKNGAKLTFSQLGPYVTPNLIEECWYEVLKALRTSSLTSLAQLPDPECPKCGSEGSKSGQIRLKKPFAHINKPRGSEGVEHGRNTTGGIEKDQGRPFFRLKLGGLQKWQKEAQIGPNMIK